MVLVYNIGINADCISYLSVKKKVLFLCIFAIYFNCFFASVFRLVIIFVPDIRFYLLNGRNRMVPRELARKISKKLDLGDWWLVYMLGRNMDPIIFKDVLTELAEHIETTKKRDK